MRDGAQIQEQEPPPLRHYPIEWYTFEVTQHFGVFHYRLNNKPIGEGKHRVRWPNGLEQDVLVQSKGQQTPWRTITGVDRQVWNRVPYFVTDHNGTPVHIMLCFEYPGLQFRDPWDNGCACLASPHKIDAERCGACGHKVETHGSHGCQFGWDEVSGLRDDRRLP